MESKRVRVTKAGRIQIPQEFLDAIGREPDEPVIVILEDDNTLRVLSHHQSHEEAHRLFRQTYPAAANIDLTADFLEWK